MTVTEHDDALAAQREHDRQRAQYARAARKRRQPQTTATTTATAAPALRRSDDDSNSSEICNEHASDEGGHARASAAARTQDVDDYIAANRNPNTHAAYTSTYRQFVRWARDIEDPRRSAAATIDVDRPNATDIALYLRYIVETRHATAATMTAALAGVADHIRYAVTATYNPCADARVTQMRAALVPHAKPGQQKKEITWAHLAAIHAATVAAGDMLSARDSCMFMLAYFDTLRISEVARMDRCDVTFDIDEKTSTPRMRVFINRLCKNDSERKGHERLVLYTTNGKHCVARQMRAYIAAMQRLTPTTRPLFTTDAGERMQVDTPRGRLRHWMTAIGVVDVDRYGFHSLRAGGVTDAARAGVEARHIKEHGNWKSEAHQRYARASENDRAIVAAAIGGRLTAAAKLKTHTTSHAHTQ